MTEPRLVAATARRYGLSRSLLLTWRKTLAAGGTGAQANFVGAVVPEDGPVESAAHSSRSSTAPATERRIEIELTNGRHASVDIEALGRIVEVVDRR